MLHDIFGAWITVSNLYIPFENCRIVLGPMLYLVSVIRIKTLVGSNKDMPLHMWVEPIEREKASHVHVFLHSSSNTFLNILK